MLPRRRVVLFLGVLLLFVVILWKIIQQPSVYDTIHLTNDNFPVPSFILVPSANTVNNDSRIGPKRTNADRGIPKIIHQTWKAQDSLPETFRSWMESWLRHNSEWQYWFWTDAEMRNFISSAYPSFLRLYDNYPSQGYRNDAFRYFVLHHFGGLYSDLDIECLKPVDRLMDLHSCILSQEPLEHSYLLSEHGPPIVSNALMACQPRHPFFALVIDNLKTTTGWLSWNDILHATGPTMLTKAYTESHNTAPNREGSLTVDLAEPDVFQPTVDGSMVEHMRGKCIGHQTLSQAARGKVRELCERLLVHDFGRTTNPASYTTHHWTHTWAGKLVDPWGLTDMRSRFDVHRLRTEHHREIDPR